MTATSKTRGSRMTPLGLLTTSLFAMGAGAGAVIAAVTVLVTGKAIGVGIVGVLFIAWGIFIAISRDAEIRSAIDSAKTSDPK